MANDSVPTPEVIDELLVLLREAQNKLPERFELARCSCTTGSLVVASHQLKTSAQGPLAVSARPKDSDRAILL
jgi:hypothetical protein